MQKQFQSMAFGCRLNEAEKIVMDRKMSDVGFVWSDDDPECIIINSCCVTGKAEREVRQRIYQLRKKHPTAAIIVTGCAATRWLRDDEKLPQATLLLDNTQKANIVEHIQHIMQDLDPEATRIEDAIHTKGTNTELNTSSTPSKAINGFDKFTRSGRMMIKIQDGCHRYCTYCIVPFMRGAPKSKTIDEIISEIKSFGFALSEATLTAINTESFGKDTKESLITLISRVLNETDVRRLAFGSIHPWSITPEFLAYYRTLHTNTTFASFFHVPLQSGSNSVLKRMNRQYIVDTIGESLASIKAINPHAFIGTDIIVGFPGETQEEFEQTYQFLQDSHIDRFHIFRYSGRPGTASELLKKRHPEPSAQIKEERSARLIALSEKKFETFLQTQVGRTVPVLILESKTDEHQDGLTDNELPIRVTNGNRRPGTIIQVYILKAAPTHLVGEVV